MGDEERAQDSEASLEVEKKGGDLRKNISKVVAENPGIEGQTVYKDYLNNGDSEHYIRPAGTSDTAVYNQIDRLERNGLIEKRSAGNSNPLFLTEAGRMACKEEGISLPRDYSRIFIDALDELMEPDHLDPDEIEKLERVLSEELLKATIEISSSFPVPLDPSSVGIPEDRTKNWKISMLEILKGLWFFERENNAGQVFPQGDGRRTLKQRGRVEEEPSAMAVAHERECKSELLGLCEILEDLSLRSSHLPKIRNIVKDTYSEYREKRRPSSGEREISAAELEVRRKHAENDLKPELEGLRNWIEERNVGIRSGVGIRLIERYEPEKKRAFRDLGNHVPELMKRIKDFRKELEELGILNDSFLEMISGPETIATVKSCVSLFGENEPAGVLTERLKKRGVDVEKGSPFLDKSALESSEEHIKLFEERLKKMISLSAELEEERKGISKRISELLDQEALPGYCSFIREQL